MLSALREAVESVLPLVIGVISYRLWSDEDLSDFSTGM
jgi:hypothetical protein